MADAAVSTYLGPRSASDLGVTLMHEHIFVRNPELELSMAFAEWDEDKRVEEAVAGLTALAALGIETVVDLTVPGLGRDARLVGRVAAKAPLNLIAATGWYGASVLPPFFQFHGPDRLISGVEPLVELFISDITVGIGQTGVRAGMIKVMSSERGMTPDEARVMAAAAEAAQATGVSVTTHSAPRTGNGIEQQAFLRQHGLSAERLVIGHSGDTDDIDYLRRLMDAGSTIGFDRFGMAHVFDDDRRIATLLTLLGLGYADRIVLSHDAAYYSHVTPPSWRTLATPNWRVDHLSRTVIPRLRSCGVSASALDQMLIHNPRRLLTPLTVGRERTSHREEIS